MPEIILSSISIWLTGVGGMAIGFGQYDIAAIAVVLTFIILRWLTPFKQEVDKIEKRA